MGCITSRGPNWPPKPYRRVIMRRELVNDPDNPGQPPVYRLVEDYVWVYPGEWLGGGSGVVTRWDEEASPGQETAIRNLEDG